ncbi:MAG: asparaginase [Flavobacteriales bacterium]|nr:asparaginase [Flavobacteriales bacterium]
MDERSRILLIYTGGTIGMVHDHERDVLLPFRFEQLLDHVPELKAFDIDIETIQLSRIVDSSDMRPELWVELVGLIEHHYADYDGFVILHGTDTLAFTASALSFMVQGLSKPIVLTGSQLPIGMIRTDGKENLITAIEVASTKKFEEALIPEVAVYFEYRLMRGNRVTKYSAEHFDAFHSPNYPNLAEAGVDLVYNHPYLRHSGPEQPTFHKHIEEQIALLKLFPGISEDAVNCILQGNAQGVILESFGAGNGPTSPMFLRALKTAVDSGKTILNISQCLAGSVQHGRYATSAAFDEIGIISGGDMTLESGITKLMHVLGNYSGAEAIKEKLLESIAGERD